MCVCLSDQRHVSPLCLRLLLDLLKSLKSLAAPFRSSCTKCFKVGLCIVQCDLVESLAARLFSSNSNGAAVVYLVFARVKVIYTHIEHVTLSLAQELKRSRLHLVGWLFG